MARTAAAGFLAGPRPVVGMVFRRQLVPGGAWLSVKVLPMESSGSRYTDFVRPHGSDRVSRWINPPDGKTDQRDTSMVKGTDRSVPSIVGDSVAPGFMICGSPVSESMEIFPVRTGSRPTHSKYKLKYRVWFGRCEVVRGITLNY